MEQEYTFPNYEQVMQELLAKFGAEKMDTYKGHDIIPLRDMKGKAMTSSYKYLYSAPKLEKIVFGVQCYRDKLMTYTTSIWPDEQYALPIYSSFWAESKKGSYFIVDFYPIADCIIDIPYMEKYLEPLTLAYDKGLKYFPEKVSRDPDWFRALVSPYCITADFGPSTADSQSKKIRERRLGFACLFPLFNQVLKKGRALNGLT